MITLTPDSTLYVAGFVTDSGSGGFQWSPDRDRIEAFRRQWIADADTDVSELATCTPGQLALVRGDLTEESITDALNSWPELWEPSHGQNRTAQPTG